MSANGYTPTQRAILHMLSDGARHRREELRQCLSDELSPLSNIHAHISSLRKPLQRRGETIICELYQGTIHYRHVRLLASPYDGRR